MSKHTKAWNVVERTPDRQIGKSPFQCYSVDTDDGLTIAECGAGKDNAHLIAAAPELLEACKLAISSCDPHETVSRYIKSIIAKAEGEDK